MQEQLEDLLVFPGDVLGLQHDAGAASLLRCQPAPHSPWRQHVLALNQSEWLWANSSRQAASDVPGDPEPDQDQDQDALPDPELDVEALVQDGEGGWLEDVLCPVRVLYGGQSETQLQGGQLSAGLPQPGLYTVQVSHSGRSKLVIGSSKSEGAAFHSGRLIACFQYRAP